MLACRKGIPCSYMQQTTALHEHGSKCCSMDIFNDLTCQKLYTDSEDYSHNPPWKS